MAKVLIVDDALFMRAAIKQLLEKNSHEIVGEASDGEDAIAKFKELKPEIVLMDISMPRMDGIEALKQIREIDDKAKVIICSALGQQAIVAEAVRLGASNFIVKPFEPRHILAAIETII